MSLSTSTVLSPSLLDQIRRIAYELGFDRCEAAPLEIPASHQQAYQSWCENGHAGDMAYMTRDPEKRLHPEACYPGFKTALSLGVSYYQGDVPEKPGPGYGRVARYAWGLDYHTVIVERLRQLQSHIQSFLGGARNVVLAVDTKPLLERALAQSAGLGFIGKNTVLIASRRADRGAIGFHLGSWVFLGEILLDLPLSSENRSRHSRESGNPGLNPDFLDPGSRSPSARLSGMTAQIGCGGCTRCLDVCPTSAFEGPHRLIAHRCIAYLTIENKGWIPRDLRRLMGDWIFGCDLCQEVCPFNERAFQTRWPEFQPERGVGPWVSLRDVLAVPDQKTFEARWGQTPFARPRRRGLIRNACVVAGNSQDDRLVPYLKTLLEDIEPVIRGHALWALNELLEPQEMRPLAERMVNTDPDHNVREECVAVLG